MAHRRSLTLFLPAVLLSLAGEPDSTPVQVSAAWQSTVDDLAMLQGRLETPDHSVWDGDGARTGEEFDVNEYFSVLDRLSMEEGYVLDYVYCLTNADGSPRLYARPKDQQRLATCSELDASANYLDRIRTDDTEEGATVEIVTFTNWGGFSRRTYEIDRSFPHTILDSGSHVLVEYQIGIIF